MLELSDTLSYVHCIRSTDSEARRGMAMQKLSALCIPRRDTQTEILSIVLCIVVEYEIVNLEVQLTLKHRIN